jgi:rubrerythrin
VWRDRLRASAASPHVYPRFDRFDAPVIGFFLSIEGKAMSTRLDFSRLSLMDALDLASLIELEARKRYTEFADSLGSRGVDDAGGVFRSMAVNEDKHCEEIAERRLALFGDQPARVTLDDIFDVEAPAVGDVRWNMSTLKAYQLALYSEQKAFAFYDEALEYVEQPDVKALFEELREEEAEHVRMLVKIIANLPPSAEVELEDEDYDPNRPARDSFEV